MAEVIIWDSPVDVAYDLNWLQCKSCARWHQVSEEFLAMVATVATELGPGEFIALPPEGTTGAGSHCPDCGGVMGRWIPAGAIGSRPDGTYVFPGDPEDPNGGARSADLLYHRGSYRYSLASDPRRESKAGPSTYRSRR